MHIVYFNMQIFSSNSNDYTKRVLLFEYFRRNSNDYTISVLALNV